MTKTTGGILLAGAALLLAAVAARRGGEVLQPARALPPPKPAEEAVPAEEPAEAVGEPRTGPGDTAFRRFVLDRTVRDLGWTESKGRAFAAAAETAVTEVALAWSVREASPEPTLEDEALYETRKRQALSKIDALLDPSREAERQLQEGLEEWFDSIR